PATPDFKQRQRRMVRRRRLRNRHRLLHRRGSAVGTNLMRRTDKPNGSEALAQPVIHGDGVSTMPEAFAGMYQTGYNDGYTSGQETGYRKGFEEGYAAA